MRFADALLRGGPIMLTILICLAHVLLPKAAVLAAELETQAVILALSVFAFLLYRVYAHSRAAASPDTDSSFPRHQSSRP
jgi:hypothetical protein